MGVGGVMQGWMMYGGEGRREGRWEERRSEGGEMRGGGGGGGGG